MDATGVIAIGMVLAFVSILFLFFAIILAKSNFKLSILSCIIFLALSVTGVTLMITQITQINQNTNITSFI